MPRPCRDVDEIHLRHSRKQAAIGKEMSLETGEAQQPGIDKTEGTHSGIRRIRNEKHREFVDEIAIGGLLADRSGIAFGGQRFLADAYFFAEIFNLFGLGFEITIIEVGQHEIQCCQLRANMLDRMLAAIAEVFAPNRAVYDPRKQMVETSVSQQ